MDLQVVRDLDLERVLGGEALEPGAARRRGDLARGIRAVDRVADAETGEPARLVPRVAHPEHEVPVAVAPELAIELAELPVGGARVGDAARQDRVVGAQRALRGGVVEDLALPGALAAVLVDDPAAPVG